MDHRGIKDQLEHIMEQISNGQRHPAGKRVGAHISGFLNGYDYVLSSWMKYTGYGLWTYDENKYQRRQFELIPKFEIKVAVRKERKRLSGNEY